LARHHGLPADWQLILCGALWLGCATVPVGATTEDLARARDQAAQGAATFTSACAKCHGQRGEGLAGAPAILGPGALPEFPRNTGGVGDPTVTDPQLIQIQAQTRPAGAASRDRFRNGHDLYNFMGTHMARLRAPALKDGDSWAVTGFMLAAQGASLPQGGVGPANAASIPIPKR
jgi:hypothetical protein